MMPLWVIRDGWDRVTLRDPTLVSSSPVKRCGLPPVSYSRADRPTQDSSPSQVGRSHRLSFSHLADSGGGQRGQKWAEIVEGKEENLGVLNVHVFNPLWLLGWCGVMITLPMKQFPRPAQTSLRRWPGRMCPRSECYNHMVSAPNIM